jgi:hypothetical protein
LKEELAFLNRKLTQDLEMNTKVAKEKLKISREKEKKRKDSLTLVQAKEREQTRLRTEKRLEELRLKQISKRQK